MLTRKSSWASIQNNVCAGIAVKFMLISKRNSSELFYCLFCWSWAKYPMSMRIKSKLIRLHYSRTKAVRENYIMRCIKWWFKNLVTQNVQESHLKTFISFHWPRWEWTGYSSSTISHKENFINICNFLPYSSSCWFASTCLW